MIRLHLVGFTTDLKNLIFARRRGAKTGGFVLAIDARLRRTLEEVARLEQEEKAKKKGQEEKLPAARPASKLTVKEIQNLLRRGKSAQEVARLAETEATWIERFMGPILAERAEVADSVKAGWIQKQRLGRSGLPVGEAIVANLRDRRVSIPPEILDEGWDAVMRDGEWEVRFRYLFRGQQKEAGFSFDPSSREVRALNDLGRDLGWRPAEEPSAASAPANRKRGSRPRRRRRRPSKPQTASTRRGGQA